MRSHLAAALLLALTHSVAADGPPAIQQPIPVAVLDRKEPVTFERDIAPILANKCLACHSGPVKKGDLDLASYPSLMKGGKQGPAVVAGKAGDSLLLRLAGKAAKPFMPPKGEDPLTSEELGLLKLWIDQGAQAPTNTAQSKDVVRAPAPAVRLVRSVVISPDGAIVIGSRSNQIHVFDTKSGTLLRSLVDVNSTSAHRALVESLALSVDGKVLASGSYQEVAIWDLETGKLQLRLTGFADRVVALSFSPDGKYLATGGGVPTVDGEVKIFEVATGKLTAELAQAHSDTVFGLSYSPDGDKLATASGDFKIKVFAAPSGKLLKTLEGHSHHVLDVAWKPDGKLLASAGADRVVKLWDYERGEQLTKLGRNMSPSNDPLNIEHTRPVCRVGFLADTWQVVACGGDQPVRLWKIEESARPSADKMVTYRGHTDRLLRTLGDGRDYLYALAVSTDGSLVAVGGEEGSVRLYDAKNGSLLKELNPNSSR